LNQGNSAASNLYLTVESTHRFTHNINNSENYTTSKDVAKELVLHAPRFAAGPGSFINVSTYLNPSTKINPDDYIAAYVTFDQGSVSTSEHLLHKAPTTAVGSGTRTWVKN
jgi:hypothetical protein